MWSTVSRLAPGSRPVAPTTAEADWRPSASRVWSPSSRTWQWLPQDEAFAAAFETGLSYLRRYVAAHGTSTVPQRDVIDGFPIGIWVATRRADYRRGRLSAARIMSGTPGVEQLDVWLS